jgi:hypothetical protein
MPAAKYLLLVIDLLNDYFRQQPRLAAQRGPLVAAVNRLAAAFRRAGQSVVWIRQEFAPDLSDAFLLMRREGLRITVAGTDGCELLPELERHASEKVLVKKRYSAFFGTDLDETLAAIRPVTLVLAGINTHALRPHDGHRRVPAGLRGARRGRLRRLLRRGAPRGDEALPRCRNRPLHAERRDRQDVGAGVTPPNQALHLTAAA